MKRVHRRFHLLLWVIVGPAAAAGLVLALQNLPADPRVELPGSAVTDGGR